MSRKQRKTVILQRAEAETLVNLLGGLHMTTIGEDAYRFVSRLTEELDIQLGYIDPPARLSGGKL